MNKKYIYIPIVQRAENSKGKVEEEEEEDVERKEVEDIERKKEEDIDREEGGEKTFIAYKTCIFSLLPLLFVFVITLISSFFSCNQVGK